MIKSLTSLRFIFAFMVFLSHLDFLENNQSDIVRWIYQYILKEGYIGVSFFFILSGFILALNYRKFLLSREKTIKEFYIARFARIYPLHLLTFIVSIPLMFGSFSGNFLNWSIKAIANITLTQSFFPQSSIYFSFNSPSWSISDEMFFYLLFPFLLYFIYKFIKCKYFYIVLLVGTIPVLSIFIPEKFHHWVFYIAPITRIFDFALGILLYNLYSYISENKLRIKVNYSALEFGGIILLVLFFCTYPLIPQVARYSFYYWIPMCYLIFVFAFQKGALSKLLSNKTLIHLGEISFGFYMIHQLVIKYFLILANKSIINIDNAFIPIVLFVITLLLSHFSYLKVEKPLNKWIKSKK